MSSRSSADRSSRVRADARGANTPRRAFQGVPRGVALLGSTGSIGRQALQVLERLPELRIVALAAGSNEDLLADQAARTRPAVVGLGGERGERGVRSLRDRLGSGIEIEAGADALLRLVTRPDVDLVVVGTGGMVSLSPVLAALQAGKVVATANKETLVAGGHLVMPLARSLAARRAANDPRDPFASPLAWLRPIDSEHSAIWQCLAGERLDAIDRLILTASGGPFLDLPAEALAKVTIEAALRHPTWRMGDKITIDSATLANKGLEVIEAHWLYDVGYDSIDVIVHPQSIVHSAVVFVDGSLKAQLGTPDMRLPIQYALTYPERRPSPSVSADLIATARLDFREPDMSRFPALRIAREAGAAGPWATAALIAADEVAVQRFLDGSLGFNGIPALLELAVSRYGSTGVGAPEVDDLLELDREIRAWLPAIAPQRSSR